MRVFFDNNGPSCPHNEWKFLEVCSLGWPGIYVSRAQYRSSVLPSNTLTAPSPGRWASVSPLHAYECRSARGNRVADDVCASSSLQSRELAFSLQSGKPRDAAGMPHCHHTGRWCRFHGCCRKGAGGCVHEVWRLARGQTPGQVSVGRGWLGHGKRGSDPRCGRLHLPETSFHRHNTALVWRILQGARLPPDCAATEVTTPSHPADAVCDAKQTHSGSMGLLLLRGQLAWREQELRKTS